ncbi:hypothetical protein [Actinomadura harenae]|uniref:Uncharacterized protein n=1 Tax=Actinomadura harenae TaxID=2483351 RepID=A0A3M2MBX3_9ACTN|nr:hypothetical protein [Actinomadura harenae]RMI47012.1 hypothetical protein EBO15_05180 [Actinomadura harenae]
MAEDGLRGRLYGLLLPADELYDPPESVPEVLPGLHMVIAVDGDAGLDEGALNALGGPEEQLELAFRNLRELPVGKHEVVHADKGGTYHVLTGPNAFTASRVLVLDAVARQLTGQDVPDDGALFSIPDKFHILLHPISGGTVLTALAAMAEDTAALFSASETRLSPHVYWWRDGESAQLTEINGRSLTFDFPDAFRAMLGDIPEPVDDPVGFRKHHYHFVHTVLRQVSEEHGPALLATTPPGDLTDMLVKTWGDVGDDLPAGERVPPEGLRGNLIELNGNRLILVTLPEPVAAAEAYFAMIVQPAGSATTRFFTLEYAVDPITHEPGAILGEWTPEGHHLHLTDMATDPGTFLRSTAALLLADGEAEPAANKRRGLFRRR